jgi:hypothetical protein
MDTKSAKIYYMPPLSNRVNQISWAQQLLESRGLKVKVVEARQLSSGERRALEQGGHTYPVVFLFDKFISIEQLEVELDRLMVPPSPKGTPIKQQAPPMELTFGASPPGPQSIFLSHLDATIDSSPSWGFLPSEKPVSETLPDEKVKRLSASPPLNHYVVDPSSFGPSGAISDVLEEIDDEYLEIHPIASPSRPELLNTQSRPPTASSSFNGSSGSPQQPYVHNSPNYIASPSETTVDSGKPAPLKDPRTERLIWLFNGIKEYCASSEFQGAVNLLGKTANMVETQAKTIWSYFGWGSKTEPPAPTPALSAASSSTEQGILPSAPADTELTLTLLVVRNNWYGRDQYRFLRLDATGFVRLRPNTFEEADRTQYEQLVSAQVTGSTIKFRYHQGDTIAEISYNFGDAEVARMIAEALKFLKGKGTVAVSYVGT